MKSGETMGKKRECLEHDVDARSDKKIIALLRKYGMKGYGMFWAIVETMSRCENYRFECSEVNLTALAHELGEDEDIIQEFLESCSSKAIGLFKYSSEENVYWSDTLVVRMQKSKKKTEAKSKAGKAAMEKRWNKEEKKEGKTTKTPPEKVVSLYDQIIRYFPENLHPRTDAIKNKWYKTIDELLRIDGLNEDEIIRIVKKTRVDDFWKDNFLSILKMRRKNKDGVMYWLVFKVKFDDRKAPQFKKTGGTKWLR